MFLKNRFKIFKTIGFKITLWHSLSVLIILIFAGSFLYYNMKRKLNNEVNCLLLDESEDILGQFLDSNFHLEGLKQEIESETTSGRFRRISARLLDIGQQTIIISKNFFDPSFKISNQALKNAKNKKYTIETVKGENVTNLYRVLTKPIFYENSLKYLFQVAIFLEPAYKASKSFRENILILIPGIIVISIFGGFFIARRSLAPVGYIIRSTNSITASKLNTRIDKTTSADELEELTDTINHMLNRLEDSFKMIVRFTADISHELRTPLTTLKAETEIILSRERTIETYRELHESNLNEYEKIIRMIEDLLVLLRSDSGEQNLNIYSFSLGKMLNELSNNFRLIADSKKINLLSNVTDDIHILGDKKLLNRLFSNLLDNAIKYTPQGGLVYITVEEIRNGTSIIIEDTGIGISKDHSDKIFDRFFRSDSSRSRETGGAGLGLSIAKNIIELHNGKINVKSTLGVGSAFIVTLPKKTG